MKKIFNYTLMFILLFVFAVTVSIEGLPMWMYIIGIFGPMLVWYLVKPHKVLEGTKLQILINEE